MGFTIEGVVNIDADISKFSSKMDDIEAKYTQAKEKVESDKISTAPLADDRTKGDVESSYSYMFDSFSQAKTILESLQNVGTSLPQNIQKAISSLVGGIDQSLTNLTGTVTTAGKKMKTSFNDVGFNNNIRFASESVQAYTKDLQSAIESAQSLSKRSRAIVDQNVGQIAAVVSPAISRMSIHDKASMSDAQIVEQMMTGRDYSHIPALLHSIGLHDDKQIREALNFAVKTSTSRIFRRDAATGYRYAGMKDSGDPILVSDMVQGAYKDALFTGGRYIDEKVTPTPKTNGASDKEKTRAYYQAIRKEVMRGNSVAYNAARDAGLIQQSNGEYSFAREGDVLNNPAMLNQFAGLVTREAHHALQGQPQHRRRLDDPNNQSALLGKDSTRIREARYLMNLDQRPDAAPYVAENYVIPEGVGYRTGKQMAVPELKIPETINIPRMTVRQTANGPQLMVARRNKDNNLVYEPDLNFQWQKQGLQETLEDEWVTMGRNPVIDRLERLSKRTDLKPELREAIAGFKFEDRTFGRGYDKNNEAVAGAPLIVDVPLDYFYDKNKYGEMQFRTKENGDRESYFSGDNETLINEMYKGNIRPVLSYGGKNLDYRVFAGKTTGGGSLKLMLNSAYEALEQEDAARGLPSMLNFFNELGPNGILINPKTGKEFENTEAANAAYAKWFDARNKILSHSVPIESLGGKTPTAALVNLDAAYSAMNMPKSHRFDGGGFIDPDVYTQDFQARMGPAKFLAQRFDWKQWFKDTGYAYQGGEYEGDKDYHFFMPGMATSADDYKKYRAALQSGLGLGATSFTMDGKKVDFGGQTFKDWRDQRFVDVMSDDYKAVLFDTTLKSTAKLSSVTPEQYQRIVAATSGKEGTSFTADQMMQVKNGMVPLSTKQQTELFGMMADPEYGFGLRLMKDTENYAGKKDFWTPAYMSAVMMTPALMRQSQENYEKAFQELSTPEGIIKRMFSGNDIDSLRVQRDPSLIYRDKFIQQSVQAEINDLEDKQMRGYAYMPGSAQMLLATANPTFLAAIGKDMTGKELSGIAAELAVGEHGVIAPTVSQEGTINWTRSPYAPGASFFASPYARTAANRYRLSQNSAMFNVEDFYTLNTGDFDGDFVWAYQTLKNDEDFKQRTEERNRRVQELAAKREAEEERIKAQNEAINGKQDRTVEHDVTGFGTATLRTNNTLGPIGLGYKEGQAWRQIEATPEELAQIDDYANKTYANGIDMVKHADVKVAQALGIAREAMSTRQPIERMTDALLSEKETGSFGATDIFKYGLPTYIDPIGTSILSGAAAGRRANVNYGERIKTAIRDNIEHRYAGAYQEERDLADWYGGLLGGKLSGEFQISSLQDLSEGRTRLAALGNRIKAITDNNPQAEELKDMNDLYRHAENALKLEETLGYNEGNLESIKRYNAAMHWDNPVAKYGFKTKSEQDAATILYEREQAARIAEAEQSRKSEIAQAISAQTGKSISSVDEGYLADRLMAAHMFTGFNWSNAKNWMDGTLRANGATFSGLRREEGPTTTVDVDYNAAVEEENRLRYTHGKGMSRKEQVARQILTGESFTDADAIVGLAAHAYMDAYGSARALSGRNSQGDIKTSAKEAADTAYKAFEEELLGKNGVLTDEQKKARQDAGGISFSKDAEGLITASYGLPEDQLSKVQKDTLTRINNKLALASRTNWANQTSSLDDVASKFYEEAFTNAAGEHMIMTEGTPFELGADGKLQQVASRRREGHNGIWMKPTRDGKEVIDFERYSKDAAGHTVVSNAGMYFTPDMIKKDDNGNITIVDWKSSQHGQKDALFQMGFYAHQLEQLGRQYHETGDENLKWFGQFVDKDTERSRVTGLQAVNMFGKNGQQVLSYNYTQEWGDQVSKAVEGGMQNLAEDAKKGFYAQIKDNIGVRIGDRQVGGSRPTVAPEIKEEDAHFSNLEEAGLIGRLLSPLRMNEEVAAGRTGIRDGDGHYIDQDKSFLVAKYMKDKEELDEINAFANKQNRYLNNRSFEQLDPFTRNIDALRSKFGEQDYATIQKYMQNPLQYAPDLELMSKDFDQTQHEALQTTMRLMGLRRQYVDQLDESMGLDYNKILYGEGDELSKLRSGTAKYQKDLSALEAVRAEERLYNVKTGRFKTREELDAEIEARRENESEDQYTARVEKSRRDNEKLAEESERLQTRYDTQEKSIKEAFGTFEGGWIENFKKSAEYLDSGLGALFKGGSIDAAVTGLQSRARDYTREADTKLPDETYLHGTDEREAIASLVTRLQERSQEFAALKGSPFEALLGFGKEFNMARINAAMTGTQISREDTKKKAMFDFANAFVQANPNATAQQLMESVGVYGYNYDRQFANQEAFRNLHQQNQLAAINDQSIARVSQMERQFESANRQQAMRYANSRLLNAVYGVQQRKDSAEAQYENYSRQIEAEKRTQSELRQKMFVSSPDSKEYKEAASAYEQSQARLNGLTAAAGEAKNQLDQLNSVGTMGKAVFEAFGQSINMLMQRFGRQLFQKALTEAKKFVQEFDKSMTSIQMITLKSDGEMSSLGDGLIEKAKTLKISISEITKSAETLYRQGLSDEEVNERLDVISKFSKVSGTNVDSATKLITVAMNTGLVSNPQQAADIVTALGDNAATNAKEIEKGIEKAGAAAAADGTSFGELAAMLTAITSTTQIGGNVAGRTLNTIFGRMNKIGTNELIVDENGNKVSGSAVAKLLKAQGISMYDEQGNKRSSYDTLYALSQKWEGMSDAEQQQIATAIAGTRMYSNFAAIMQGMSEGKVDEYMDLLNNSSGIVDEKYQIYTESLEASLTDLKNTFDGLVKDLTDSGALTGFLSTITNMIQGVDNLSKSFGGLGAMLTSVLPMMIAMTLMKTGMSTGSFGMIAGGLALGIGTGLFLNAQGNQEQEKKKTTAEIASENKSLRESAYNDRISTINRAKELNEKGAERTDAETNEFKSIMAKLSAYSGVSFDVSTLDNAASSASSGIDALSSSIAGLESASKSASDVIDEAEKQAEQQKIDAIYTSFGETSAATAEEVNKKTEEALKNPSFSQYVANNASPFWYNRETGEYTINGTWTTGKKSQYTMHGDNAPYNDGVTNLLRGIQEERESQDTTETRALKAAVEAGQALLSNGIVKKGVEIFTDEGSIPDEFEAPKLYGIDPKEYIAQLAPYLAKYSNYYTETKTDAFGNTTTTAPYSGWTTDRWTDYLTRVSKGEAFINDDYFKFVAEQESLIPSKTGYETQREALIEQLKTYIAEYVPEDMRAQVAEKIADDYYAEMRIDVKANKDTPIDVQNDVIQGLKERATGITGTGLGLGTADIIKNLKAYLYPTSAEELASLEAYGLEDVGNTGYYVDNLTGQRLTRKELLEGPAKYHTAYGVQTASGNKITTFDQLAYENPEQAQVDAQNAVDALNQLLTLRASKHMSTWGDAAGTVWTGYDQEGYDELVERREKALEHPYRLYDSTTGDYLGQFDDYDKAEEAQGRYAHWYLNGQDYGYGTEGMAKAKAAEEEQAEWFVDGVSVGIGAQGKERASWAGKYHFFDGNEPLYFADEATANEYYEKHAARRKLKVQDRINELELDWDNANFELYNTDKEEYFRQKKAASEQWAIQANNEIPMLTEVAPTYIETDGPTAIAGESQAVIRDTIDVIGEVLQDAVPSVSDLMIDNPDALTEILSKLPKEIQEGLIDGTLELTDEVLELIEEVSETVSQTRFTAVKNHFAGQQETYYQAWKTANDYGLTADSMLRMINQNGLTNINDLMEYVNTNGIKAWDSLYNEKHPEFGRIMGQIQYDEHGNITSAPEDIMDQLINYLYSNGLDYGARQLSVSEKAQSALTAFRGLTGKNPWFESQQAKEEAQEAAWTKNVNDYTTQIENLEKLNAPDWVKDNIRNQITQSHPQTKEDFLARHPELTAGVISSDQKTYLEEALGKGLTQTLIEGNASDVEEAYAQMVLENRANGITELTTGQKASLSSQVLADLRAGNASKYVSMDDTARAAMMQGISGTSDLYQMALALENAGLSFEDAVSGKLTDEQMNAAFGGRYTAADLRATNLSASQAAKLNSYRNAANYQEISSMYSGLTNQKESERIKTVQAAQSSQQKLQRANFALNQLDTSKAFEEIDSAVIDELVSATGYTKDQIKDMWKDSATGTKTKLQQVINAQSSELSDTLIATYDILAEGADVSNLGENVGTEELASYFDETNAALANYIRAVGLVIKDGKVQIEEGTESIFTSLQEMQTAADSASKTKATAMSSAKTAINGTEGTLQSRMSALVNNKEVDLTSIDDNLRYMLTAAAQPGSDITQEELNTAWNAALYGGSTTSKYGYASRKLFGGFQNRTWNAEELSAMKTTYQNEMETKGADSPLVQMWDAMLSDMGDSGNALRDYLNGVTTELPDNFVQTYAEWLANEGFKGMEDAAELAANVGKLSSGKASDRGTIESGYYDQLRKIGLAQYGISGNNTAENRGYISSLLGYSDEYINEKLQTEGGKADLQSEIDEKLNKIKDQYKNIINSFFPEINVDFSNLDQLKSDLEAAADDTNQEIIDLFIGWIDGLKNVNLAPNKSFQEVIDETTGETQKTQTALEEAGKIIEAGTYANLIKSGSTESTAADWSKLPTNLQYMMYDRAKGNETFTNEEIEEARQNAIYGRTSSPEAQQKMLQSLFGGNMNPEDMVKTYQGWKANPSSPENAAKLAAFEGLDEVEALTEAMSSQEGAVDKTKEALENYNEEVGPRQAKYLKQYGDYTDEAANSMLNLRKGGKTAVQELAKIKSGVLGLQDSMTAVNKARGKSGKQLDSTTKSMVASYLGVDAKTVEKYTKEELNDILDKMESAVNSEFNAGYFQPMLQGAFEDINKAIEEGHITYEQVVDVVTKVNDSGDMSAFVALLQSINSDYASVAESMAGQIATYFINIVKKMNGESATVDVSSSASGSTGSVRGGGSYNKGGGGGGGKSASQKLIDEWKHKVTAQQHEVTMAGIQATDAGLANDGGAYIAAVDKQISENEKLRKVYEEELEALKAQLATVSEGSDDWWALKEAIQSAEEAQAQLNQTIAELEKSKINEIVEAYEYLSSLSEHQSTVASSHGKRAQQLLNYDAWQESIEERVQARRDQTSAAQDSLQQIQQQYDAYLAGGGSADDDTAREYIKQMNALREVIESEASDIQDILNEQLDIARTQRDTELIIPDYYSSMLDSIIDKLDDANDSKGQLAALEAKKSVAQQKIDVYRGSNEVLAQQLQEEFNKNGYSQQYYEILKEMYGNLEAIAGLEQEIRDATAARLDVITEFFDNKLNQNTHDATMLDTQQSLLDFYNDYGGRSENVAAQRENLSERKTQLQQKLNTLAAEQSNYEEGDANWIRARDEMNKVIEELYGIQLEETELDTAQFTAAKENFDNMMKPFTHADNMYSIDAERFGRLNDYENQNAVIDYQLANNKNKKDVYKQTIDEMKKLRQGVAEGSDAWWNYTNAINEAEEAMAKLDNEAAKLRAQKLTNLLEKQQNEDKAGNHKQDMLGIIASRALATEDYDTYYATQTDKLYNIKDTIDQNKNQVAELEELLATYEIGSDEWLKTRDEIWKIKKETAQKENEAIQIEQEIARQRLAQITQELNRNTKYDQHRNTMMQSYGTIYQRYGNYQGYRNTIDVQLEDWQGIKTDTEKARAQVLEQMEGLEIGTKEWYDARDAVYAYDEALLRADVEMENLFKAKNMSYLQEVADQFNNLTQQYNYSLSVVRAAKTKASSRNTYEDYKKYSEQEKQILTQQIQSRNAYVEEQKRLMSGFIKDTEEWKQAKQNIINAMLQNVSDQSTIDQLDLDLAKSWVDKVFEGMDWADSETEHNLNLIQYEQTKYQNRGELTNYAIMLEKENEVRQSSIDRRKAEIKQLKEEQEQLKNNAEEYNRITEKIKAKEEAVKADTVAIEENTQKLKENSIAILDARIKVEEQTKAALEDMDERKKKMLDAEVNLQKIILDTIKQRYKDEWDLQKKDIDKQKQALQEYKRVLNERLNARKEAMNTEEKYRQLEEYQSQLVLISADPTRTKDAKTLREQIRQLQKDIAWDTAAKQVEAESEAIDQAIESLDDYVTVHSEDLEALLADSRNFAEEVNLILSGSFDSIVDWLKANNVEYKNSLDASQTQMKLSWEQTWKDMLGIATNYWPQVDEILSSYENFVNFITETPSFLEMSATQQAKLLLQMASDYEAYASSAVSSIEAINYALDEHEQKLNKPTDEDSEPDLDLSWLDDIGQEKPEQATSPLPDIQTYSGVGQEEVEHIVTPGKIETEDTYDQVGIEQTHEDYKPTYAEDSTPDTPAAPESVYHMPGPDDTGFGDFQFPTAEDIQHQLDQIEDPHIGTGVQQQCGITWKNGNTVLATQTVNKGSTPSYSGATPTKAEDSNYTYEFSGWSPAPGPVESDTTYIAQFKSTAKPQTDTDTDVQTTGGGNKQWHATVSAEDPTGGYTKSATGTGSTKDAAAAAARAQLPLNNYRWVETGVKYSYYKKGGLVDYTGPAWVDGSPTEPESFLSAYDTKALQALTEVLKQVYVPASITPSANNFNGNTNYGDIYITINQAELKDDADFEQVARRVGQAFTKEMTKQGFNMNGYSF